MHFYEICINFFFRFFKIAHLKEIVADRNSKLQDAKDRSDSQIMQIRVILDKSERDHQRELDAVILKREEGLGNLSFIKSKTII